MDSAWTEIERTPITPTLTIASMSAKARSRPGSGRAELHVLVIYLAKTDV